MAPPQISAHDNDHTASSNNNDHSITAQQEQQPILAIGPPPPPSSMQLALLPSDQQQQSSYNNSNNKSTTQTSTNPVALMKRSDSGFVGLSNQGATCYLNSLIQALYMTPELRQLVYQWKYNPSVHASAQHCIPLQLQKLFARLQLSEKRSAVTKGLTTSFGWTSTDAFIQHDVQELCRVLMDALDESFEQSENHHGDNNSCHGSSGGRMKYGRVSNLYKGVMLDYIQVVEPCTPTTTTTTTTTSQTTLDTDGDVQMSTSNDGNDHQNVENEQNGTMMTMIDQKYRPVINASTGQPYGRVREDAYMDIQLVVRDMDSVEQSLQSYIRPELLTGDNQWCCEDLNNQKVDAKKGLALKTLPYLLSLQLNRFDYDYVTWQRIKLANRITFPFYLDMSPFVVQEQQQQEQQQYSSKLYELFAVLIHSGSANGGHYFAYIKSFENGKWYNFNDSSVQEIDEEAVKVMYGGSSGEAGRSAYKSVNASTNAYMLMYRLVDPERNLMSVPDSMIPNDIRREVEEENEQFREEVRHKEREQQIAKVKVFLPKIRGDYSRTLSLDVELEKNATFIEAKKQIFAKAVELEDWSERESSIDNCRIREYDLIKRRPGKVVRSSSDDAPISTLGIRNYSALTIQTKYPDEDWPVEHQTLHLLISPLNPETKSFDQFLPRNVRGDQTLRELKQELSSVLGEKYPAELLNIVTAPSDGIYNQYNAQDEDKRIDADLGIKNSDMVYVEVLDNVHAPSVIVEKLHEMENMINVYFNKPDNPLVFDQTLEVDRRGTVLDVKRKISEMIGVPCDKFRMCQKISKSPLNNERQLIKDCRDIFDYCQLYVELGDSLRHDEILLNVSLFEYLDTNMISEIEKQATTTTSATSAGTAATTMAPSSPPPPTTTSSAMEDTDVTIGPKTEEQSAMDAMAPEAASSSAASSSNAQPSEPKDPSVVSYMESMKKLGLLRKRQFHDLGKLIVREDMTILELKQAIRETFFKDDIYMEPSLLRVRIRQYLSLGNIFKNESATLKESFPGLTTGRSIVVQKLNQPEHLSENDLIVHVQRWMPSVWEFKHGPMRKFEVIINREHTKSAQALKQAIYEQTKTELFPETLLDANALPAFNIQEHLGVSKAPNGFEMWYKKECAEVALLNWNSLADRKTKEPLSNIFGPPLCTAEDDLFIIRDMREPEKYDLEEVRGKVSASTGERGVTIKVFNKKQEEEEEQRKQQEAAAQLKQDGVAAAAASSSSSSSISSSSGSAGGAVVAAAEEVSDQPLSKKQKTTSPDDE